jgi:hypothetical protein
MLYGVGWAQRWQVADGARDAVESEIGRVGQDATGHLTVLDPGTGESVKLVVAWKNVAAAVVLGSEDAGSDEVSATGQYS